MADFKNPTMKPFVPVDAWQTDQSTWEYITIPEDNAIGEKHAAIGNNRHTFEAGKTYLVPPAVAMDVRDRLKAYAKSVVRVMRPNVDVAAQHAVAVGSANSAGAQPVDATKITTLP